MGLRRLTEAARIAAELRLRYPSVVAVHLGTDNGPPSTLWYFKFDRTPGEVVLHSPTGDYPFFIRTAADEPDQTCEVVNRPEAVLVISKYLDDFLESLQSRHADADR